MTAIFVEDVNNGAGIGDASFDHSYSNAGNGYYDVGLDVVNGDYVFTTYAPAYDARQWDIRYGQVVALTPAGSGTGRGSCF